MRATLPSAHKEIHSTRRFQGWVKSRLHPLAGPGGETSPQYVHDWQLCGPSHLRVGEGQKDEGISMHGGEMQGIPWNRVEDNTGIVPAPDTLLKPSEPVKMVTKL